MPRNRLSAARSASIGRKSTTDTSGASQGVLSAMSERVFQAHVVAGLMARGWHVWVIPDMRKTRRGWPDVVALHPARPGCLLAWELKAENGRVRPEQGPVIEMLATVPGVDARIVRPSQWPSLRDALDARRTGAGSER